MGWAARTKHRGPGPVARKLTVGPERLAQLAGSLDGLDALLAQIPDPLVRKRIFDEVMPFVAKLEAQAPHAQEDHAAAIAAAV